MIKGIFLKFLNLFSGKVIFPLSRWHNSNLFIYTRKNSWLQEKPSLAWLIFGRLFMAIQMVNDKVVANYLEAIVSNYSRLVKKHYFDNYAYGKDALSDPEYRKKMEESNGSIQGLFKNSWLLKIAEIKNGDSFLECGCGQGNNIKDVFTYFPDSKVTAFDLSPNVVDFAKDVFRNKAAHIFQGSALDAGLWNGFPNKSVDNIFFANMLATILSGGIARTRQARIEIISEAVRIARKNVIICEGVVSYTRIYIEQKYRAIFYDDYAEYFKGLESHGDLLVAPRLLVFHKK